MLVTVAQMQGIDNYVELEQEDTLVALDALEERSCGKLSVPWGVPGFAGEPTSAAEPVPDRCPDTPTPSRELYLAPDGTPMIWDAETALLLRSTYRMLPRPVGMPSVRLDAGLNCLPATLMTAEAAFAVEKGWLKLVGGQRTCPPACGGRHASSAEKEDPPVPVPPSISMIRNYQDPRQRDLRLVYKDLWIRGMTIGTGHPYGVDFTIYEAIHVIRGDASLSCQKAASIVRLEQSVLKSLVIAVVSDKQSSSCIDSKSALTKDRVIFPPRANLESEGDPSAAAQKGGTDVLLPGSKFGPPRSCIDGNMIEYMTFRFLSVSRRMN